MKSGIKVKVLRFLKYILMLQKSFIIIVLWSLSLILCSLTFSKGNKWNELGKGNNNLFSGVFETILPFITVV